MKRDIDLCRRILIVAESESASVGGLSVADICGLLKETDADRIGGQVSLLELGGYLDIRFQPGSSSVMVSGVTWKGLEWIDACHDDQIFQRVREVFPVLPFGELPNACLRRLYAKAAGWEKQESGSW